MPILNLSVALVFVCLLVWLVLAPRKPVRAPAFSLLRCFFPAWRFFEELDSPPLLSYRVIVAGQQPGQWTRALVAAPMDLRAIVLNTRGNLHLACQSLVEQLNSELDAIDAKDAASLTSYQLVQSLIHMRVRASVTGTRACVYQFRLTAWNDEQLFMSATHALK
jgi:hypothetical protein